jgi:hypothetical protein
MHRILIPTMIAIAVLRHAAEDLLHVFKEFASFGSRQEVAELDGSKFFKLCKVWRASGRAAVVPAQPCSPALSPIAPYSHCMMRPRTPAHCSMQPLHDGLRPCSKSPLSKEPTCLEVSCCCDPGPAHACRTPSSQQKISMARMRTSSLPRQRPRCVRHTSVFAR